MSFPRTKRPQQSAVEALLGLLLWFGGVGLLVWSLGWAFGVGVVLTQLGAYCIRLSQRGV